MHTQDTVGSNGRHYIQESEKENAIERQESLAESIKSEFHKSQ